jgi:hypothetical protein
MANLNKFFLKGRQPKKMDDLQKKWKTTSKKNERQPQKNGRRPEKMEDNLKK